MPKRARDVMTVNPALCKPETSLDQVAKLMVQHDCGEIPVIDSAQQVVGVVTDRDIVVRVVAKGVDAKTATVADCLSSPCVTVREDSSLADCCSIMESNQIRRVPVVDEQGCICGIVSLADVAQSGNQHKTAEIVKEVSAPQR